MRRLRREGNVPAVIYGAEHRDREHHGHGGERCTKSSPAGRAWSSSSSTGRPSPAVIKEVQFDHLGSDIYHVDFERINLEEIVRVQVPVETHGTAKGTRNGGVMRLVHRHVTVECHAGDIPNEIVVEVGDLDIDQSITVGQLALPAGREGSSTMPATIVVIVHAPRAARRSRPSRSRASLRSLRSSRQQG